MLARLVSPEASLLGWQMATFSLLCPCVVIPLRVHPVSLCVSESPLLVRTPVRLEQMPR